MKKRNKLFIVIVLALFIFIPNRLPASTISIGLHGGYNFFTNDTFKNVYKSGTFTFGLNGSFKLFPLISLDGAIDYYSVSGQTAVTKSEISLDCKTIRLGGSFSLGIGGIAPKIGVGLAYHWIDEEDPWGGTGKSKLSWYGVAGIDLNLSGPLAIGGELLYRNLSLEGAIDEVVLSHISFLISFKIKI